VQKDENDMRLFVVGIATLLATSLVVAQQRDTPFKIEPQIVITPPTQSGPSPYVGFENREVKTLSTERQEGLKQGRGLGYALAAEINGYPGPLHVLELATQLELDADQKKRTQAIYDKMNREARTAGQALIDAEAHLDRMFQMKHATYARIEAQTAVASAQEARLRAIHLNAHIAMMEVLTPAQVESYNRLRGYREAPAETGGHHGHHGGSEKPKQ
jgi:Spy/CpxP family protein refolding chaperone